MGTGALSLGVKKSGREADHSPQTSVEVKKTWVYTSTSPYAFRDNVIFLHEVRVELHFSSKIGSYYKQ
jgi:hypothetical protein